MEHNCCMNLQQEILVICSNHKHYPRIAGACDFWAVPRDHMRRRVKVAHHNIIMCHVVLHVSARLLSSVSRRFHRGSGESVNRIYYP